MSPSEALIATNTARESLRLAAFIGLGALLLTIIPIGCPIKFFTGLSCPGCGLSRAWFALLGAHPAEAMAYHPLFWLVPFIIVSCVMPLTGRAAHIRNIALVVIIALFVALWMARFFVEGDAAIGTLASDTDVVNWVPPPWWSFLVSLI